MIVRIVADVIQAYIIVLFVRLMLSWFPLNPWSSWARVVNGLARVTDPVLAPFRRILPPLHVGGMAVDLSPIILLVALEVLLGILRAH